MKLRTYQADSMPAALGKLKADLGADAVIVNTRTYRKRALLGLRSRLVYEITATDEGGEWRRAAAAVKVETPVQSPVATVRAGQSPAKHVSDPPKLPVAPPRNKRSRAARRAAARPSAIAPAPSAPKPLQTAEPTAAISDPAAIMNEMRAIRQMVGDVLTASRRAAQPQIPPNLLDYYTRLVSRQVADELARQLIDEVRGECGGTLDVSAIHAKLLDRVAAMLGIDDAAADAPLPSTEQRVRPRVIALVGPTGVGKTTTIAKLAAQFKLRERRRIGLITIDTYRIAAVEQLKVYANILEAPLQVVLAPQDMPVAIERLRDCHTILVDTAGRSQRDTRRIGDLNSFLDAGRPDEVHLVLSSAASERTILETVRNFAPLKPHKLIFTKLDEATGLGLILNVVGAVGMRISYLTNGQSVPNDLETASSRRLAELIVGADHDADQHRAQVA